MFSRGSRPDARPAPAFEPPDPGSARGGRTSALVAQIIAAAGRQGPTVLSGPPDSIILPVEGNRMATEIERKFLVGSDEWRGQVASSTVIRQGYLTEGSAVSVRIRTTGAGSWLTVKSGSSPLGRLEFEYPIPPEDAEALLDLCRKPILEKERHLVPGPAGLTWEVDEFRGDLAGLVLAEIELPDPDAPLAVPGWIGADVTHDPRYLNSNLHRSPPPPPGGAHI